MCDVCVSADVRVLDCLLLRGTLIVNMSILSLAIFAFYINI